MFVSRIKWSEIVIILAIAALLSATALYQYRYQTNQITATSESLNYLPSGKFLKGMALGYDEALADFLWVRTVGYFGLHAKTDQDFTWLKHMLELITILDPRYESPYEFAGVILPNVMNDANSAVLFLEKGIENIPKNNPRYWLQPFYLGFCYMIHLNEPVKAADYFSIAARYPQSPQYLPLLVSKLYASENRPEIGTSILQDLLSNPNSDIMQNEYFKRAMEKRMKELIAARHLKLLNNAISDYIRYYDEKPKRLSDLVERMIIPFIPEEPHGGYYYYSALSENALSSEAEPEFVVHLD